MSASGRPAVGRVVRGNRSRAVRHNASGSLCFTHGWRQVPRGGKLHAGSRGQMAAGRPCALLLFPCGVRLLPRPAFHQIKRLRACPSKPRACARLWLLSTVGFSMTPSRECGGIRFHNHPRLEPRGRGALPAPAQRPFPTTAHQIPPNPPNARRAKRDRQ